MQLQRIKLKKLGTTERILRSDTQGNFDKLENAANSNAGATEAWYKQLDGKITTEAQTRAETDKALEDKLTAEAQTRAETDKALEQRIARLERYIFDGQPAFVDDLFPPQPSNGSIEVADNGELPPDPDAVANGEVRDTPTNIFIK